MMRATPQLEPSDNDISDITLSTQERNAIFRNLDYLDSHRINTDNDCFLDVSKDMDQRCEQMEANQLARVDAAIHLTICELKTAEHVTIPMECTEYTASSRSVRPSGSRACVEALYRSPQFWSSYSGYLRDIPQLCFAYRRWNEIGKSPTTPGADSTRPIQQTRPRPFIEMQLLRKLHFSRSYNGDNFN
ncbi:hypothetical protein FRC20_005744 [Serendipita sp. 405]|nr:hypothetical protein FRC15_005466 [Serendipita sp. 397]KAG8867448.1 hypothetical protein FRC20_005744 [Serendipita sp. 405]